MRLSAIAVLAATATALAACGDLPQPFRHEGAPSSLARPKLTRGVTVRPPGEGPEARALADALVRALEDQEVPALVHEGPAFGHVIDGEMRDGGKTVSVRWA
ncbi:MAG TPA: hypothetical protein VK196_02590, partial [Magnetospirillum sp.]|nr:hypothetical protein [Magnetospirillum sp.]